MWTQPWPRGARVALTLDWPVILPVRILDTALERSCSSDAEPALGIPKSFQPWWGCLNCILWWLAFASEMFHTLPLNMVLGKVARKMFHLKCYFMHQLLLRNCLCYFIKHNLSSMVFCNFWCEALFRIIEKGMGKYKNDFESKRSLLSMLKFSKESI